MDIDDIKKADAETADGAWVGDLPGMGDVRLRVRPLTHPRVVRFSGRAFRIAGAGKPLSADAEDTVERDVLASVVLTGWEGLTAKKKPLKFNRETALELLKLDTFEAAVRTAMYRAGAAADKTHEALEKN